MVKKQKFYPLVDNIIAYESGQLSNNEVLELFSEIIKGNILHTLQGCYGRTAQALIEDGFISAEGKILKTI
jgi:hypothetical protein